jgi:2C-methyl-D-erythritol 2,4-cyclodiphosphate synthase
MALETMSDEEILRIANAIMDNLMDASTAIDHERHIRDFSERMKAIVTKEYLQKVCEKYQREKGYFSRREPVAVFKRPGAAAIVWKQWFTNAPGEFVAEMLLIEKDGKYLVDHAMVF